MLLQLGAERGGDAVNYFSLLWLTGRAAMVVVVPILRLRFEACRAGILKFVEHA